MTRAASRSAIHQGAYEATVRGLATLDVAVVSQSPAHARPRPPVQAVCRFTLADPPQTGGEPAVVDELKTAARVVGGVPGDLGERGEGDSGCTRTYGARRQMVQQRPADTATCAVWVHRDLLDMEVSVDAVGDQVGDGVVGVIGHHPGQPGALVAGQLTQREWFILGDLRHADLSEALPGGPLDVLKDGQFVQVRGSDTWTHSLEGAG